MDILDDMEVSKLSAKVFFFLKQNVLYQFSRKWRFLFFWLETLLYSQMYVRFQFRGVKFEHYFLEFQLIFYIHHEPEFKRHS